MPAVSVTRVRLRSWLFLPAFALYSLRSGRQAERTVGLLGGWLGASGILTFWTVTAWRDEAAMRNFRDRGVHKVAMPALVRWCEEASVARYDQTNGDVPDGATALAEMKSCGRISKVRHPTVAHAAGDVVPDGRAPRIGRVLRLRASRT